MTHSAGWVMAWYRGYNDDTECWLDDGHGIEAIMMTHSAGWVMAWYRGYNDDTVLAG